MNMTADSVSFYSVSKNKEFTHSVQRYAAKSVSSSNDKNVLFVRSSPKLKSRIRAVWSNKSGIPEKW